MARVRLGLFIDQLVSGYARLLIEGVTAGCRAADAHLVVFSGRVMGSPHGHEYQNNTIYQFIRRGTVDAVVMAAGTQGTYWPFERLREYARSFDGVPLVSMGVPWEGATSVLTDNRTGVVEAVEHLATDHGAQRIAFIRGPSNNSEAESRFAAYKDCVRRLGLDDDPRLELRGDFTRMGTLRLLSTALDGVTRPPFQAVMAANDEMAIAAMEFLRARSISVPTEVSVIGFDDIAQARFVVPALTTVAQQLTAQGRTAAEIAASLARGGPAVPDVILPTRLVLRTSCGCLPGSVTAVGAIPRRASASLRRTAASPRRAEKPKARSVPALVRRCLQVAEIDGARADELRPVLTTLARKAGTDGFLDTLRVEWDRQLLRGVPLAPWGLILPLLQSELVRSGMGDAAERAAQFQTALMLLAEMASIEEGSRLSLLRAEVTILRRVTEGLFAVPSLETLANDIAVELPRLDIESCFLACYPDEIHHARGDAWSIPARARALLAVSRGNRMSIAEEDAIFAPGERFLPAGFLGEDRPMAVVATAVFFREDQLGYLVFSPGQHDSAIYEAFLAQLGNVLKGSVLLGGRERMTRTLAREQERVVHLAALVQSSWDAIFGLDMSGHITSWNGGAEVVFNLAAEDAVGRHYSTLIAPAALPAAKARWDEAAAGSPAFAFETEGQNALGPTVPLSLALSPIRDQTGAVVGVAGIARDITDQKMLQARLIQAQRLESLGTLAAGIAHQFNNINMVVKGSLDAVLGSPEITPATQPFLSDALKGVDRLIDITARLQGLTSSPGKGGSCRLHEVARLHLSSIERRVAEMNVDLILDLAETPSVRISSSAAAYILTALLTNALDALVDRPLRKITLRTRLEGDWAILEVSDTGCGMRQEDLQRLFSPFFTTKGEWAVAHSAQSRVRGVGLSLSVCHAMVSECGGGIDAESEIDRGTVFRVRLPVGA